MSTNLASIAAHPSLDRSREELAWQAYGKAAEEVRLIGQQLVQAFQTLQKQQDAITESRLGQVTPMFAKPVESAWATWRAGNMTAQERNA